MNLFSNILIVPPFKTNTSLRPLNRVNDVFAFNAKIKSISALAIDEESKNLIKESIGLSTTYAYYLNNLELISTEKPERFDFMAKNYLEAAKILEKNDKFIPLYERSNGLNNAAMAIQYFINGNTINAKSCIEKSLENLEKAKKTLIGNFDLGIMFQAVDKEILIGKAINYMIISAEHDPSGSPMNTVSLIENLIKTLSSQENYNQGTWNAYLKDICRYEEILKWVHNIRNAQYGDSTLKMVGGAGNVLLPFWVVDLPYSFKTGALWMKKGVEVTETILASAGFTSDENILAHPNLAITDVFRARQNYGFFDGIKG
ncbi:MAG: hypothetical protein MUO82_01775, partial [Candidatus Thermoplasmatota archaeon]|nr:hypothetical protein [Candidatus Thermoplasmatota archaeon]